jgi:monoamine oxidase
MPGTGDPVQRALRRRAAELRGEAPCPGTTRREFLARGGGVAAGAMLATSIGGLASASARERRAQRRQQERSGARIVIVGAGLAGLTCAYRLRKHGVHAEVFEAREHRLGGRCWTVRGFDNDQVSEHGGEFIDTRHVQIRRIVKELGLRLEDRTTGEPPKDAVQPLWLNGRLRDREKVFAGFDHLYARLKRDYKRVGDYHYDKASRAAREFDEMSALDWLEENVHDRLLREAVDIGQTGFYGIGSKRMSAINLFEAYVAPYPGADERYHTHGGNDRIPQGLAATLDDDAIHLAAPLEAMRRRGIGTYELHFRGVGKVIADRVVLCLPFTTLRRVDLRRAGLSAKRLQSIRQLGMGTNAKNHFQLRVRPYEIDKWSGGRWTSPSARRAGSRPRVKPGRRA